MTTLVMVEEGSYASCYPILPCSHTLLLEAKGVDPLQIQRVASKAVCTTTCLPCLVCQLLLLTYSQMCCLAFPWFTLARKRRRLWCLGRFYSPYSSPVLRPWGSFQCCWKVVKQHGRQQFRSYQPKNISVRKGAMD